MEFLRKLNTFLAGQRRLMAGSIFFGLVFAASGLIPPLLIRQILVWAAEGRDEVAAIAGIVVALVLAYLMRGVARYLYGLFSHIVAFRAQQSILVAVYKHVQTLPHRFFADQRVGGLVSRAVGDVEAIEDFIAHGIPETTLALTIPLAMMGAMAIINWQLTLITLAPIPLIFIVTRFLFPRIRGRWRRVRERLAEITAVVTEGISGFEVVKAFNREREQLAVVEARGEAYRREITRTQIFSMAPIGIIELIAGIGLILVIAIGGTLTLRGTVPVADLFVFVFFVSQIYQPIIQLSAVSENIQKAIASTDRVFELLEVRSDINDRPGAKPPTRPEWSVEFERVRFAYADEPVLREISFVADKGSLVALVGPTGAGKSTCAKLVPRFYDVQGGSVRIGGVDIRDVPLEWLRQQIAMVLQDVFLFEGTIWGNIQFGRPDASEDEILAAAKAANVDEFAERFPDGYQSRIGERGVRLSGGQKQRISIARAILKDAPILILDEATSSVDVETEGLIQEALSRLTRDRTTIVIAHRLSTVRRSDRIVVLRDGRVAEDGSHDELIARDGWYADMVQRQELNRDWRLDRARPLAAPAAGGEGA